MQLDYLCDQEVNTFVKADFKPFRRILSLLIPSYGQGGDRRFWRMFFRGSFVLIVNAFAFFGFFSCCSAQISNEAYFEEAVRTHLSSQGVPFNSWLGFLTEPSEGLVKIDSSSQLSFYVQSPEVEFGKLEDGSFSRSIRFVIEHQIGDSAVLSIAKQHSDTVSRKELKLVRKSKYPELRGVSPQFSRRILVPTVLIVSGITGIISLFYIRSK